MVSQQNLRSQIQNCGQKSEFRPTGQMFAKKTSMAKNTNFAKKSTAKFGP